ncbi:MAG: DJ-1/PfpI family protein [Asgard group archaeon]|nr:DJ-1/PfpI family protein [Asgard group archaeon]
MMNTHRWKLYILFLFIVIPLSPVNCTSPSDVKILMIVDHDYGGNYPYIKEIFLSYGWNVTTAGLEPLITPCTYHSTILEVDVLIQNITEITDFDCVSVIPGESHENLLNNESTLNLIQTAVSEGLIVTGWCKGVRVLAEANVIEGKNVTGHLSIQSVCEQAGATFIEDSPPIRDGNIITSVRSRYYRTETCELIRNTIYESLGITTTSTTTSTTTYSTNQSSSIQVSDTETTTLEENTSISFGISLFGLALIILRKTRRKI